jgi:hypothetical protein
VEGVERHQRPSGSGTTPLGVGFLFSRNRRFSPAAIHVAVLWTAGF